jgi:hypothetical protein
MSDEITTPAPTETEATTQETNAEPQGNAEIDWKAQARKWEARAKEALTFKDEAEKWREYESSQKSEHEKLAEELARAKAEASEASARLTRYEVAAQKGIPAEALDLLAGATREDLEAAAEKLLALIANQSKPKTPQPDSNQGKPVPNGVGQITSKEELATMSPAEIMKAKTEGRLDELLGKR